MSEFSSTEETSMEIEEDNREELNMDRGGHRLVLPEDGYEWRKYGNKFIKKIGKYRSYFRCQKQNCKAKKTVDWSNLEPDNVRVVYDGGHSHGLTTGHSGSSRGASSANQYNLLTQVFGDQPTSHISRHQD